MAECDGLDGSIELKRGTEVEIGPPVKVGLYYDGERCLWEVKAPQGSFLRIVFESFVVEAYCPRKKDPPTDYWRDRRSFTCPNVPCTRDYVSIYDGASRGSPRIAKVTN